MNQEIKKINSESKIRSSNFELLRIICMLLIVAFHYCTQGNNAMIIQSDFSMNQAVAYIFGSWGILGVDCFIFISAYFLTESMEFSSKKLFKILLQAVFYSSCLAVILSLSGNIEVSAKDFIRSVFSPFFGLYWFLTAYCMLYAISPFLNKFINLIDKEALIKFVIIMTLIIPVYKTIKGNAPISDFIMFVYLFILMGCLKKFPGNWFERNAKTGFLITSFCILLTAVSASFFGTTLHIKVLQNHSTQFLGRYSAPMVLNAVFLFYIFKNWNIGYSRLINTIAKSALGIYLIHQYPLIENLLWDGILKVNIAYYKPVFAVHLVISVFLIFIIATIIDFIRIGLFEKKFFNLKILDSSLSRIDNLLYGERQNIILLRK